MAATIAEAEGVTAAMAGAEEMAVAAAQGGPEAAAEAEEMAATVPEAEPWRQEPRQRRWQQQ